MGLGFNWGPPTKLELIQEKARMQAEVEKELAIHREIMQSHLVLQLDWKPEYFNGPMRVERCGWIACAWRMPMDLGCRWTIRPDSNRQGLTLPEIIAGRCKSVEEAMKAASLALEMLMREAQGE